MPGIIGVSVLEAVDLPEVLQDGKMGKDVTATVTLGPWVFKTPPEVPDRGRIESWNSDFSFPVKNLRDKLLISICDCENLLVTQTAIEIPSIIQKGFRDEFVSLNKGGRIHLKMRFVLTDEEREKIKSMRVAAVKKTERPRTVVFQPSPEKKPKMPPVSAKIFEEVDLTTTVDSKEPPNVAPNPDFSPKLPDADAEPEQVPNPAPKLAPKLAPKRMFNYAKAIGMQAGPKPTDRRSNLVVPDNSSTGDVGVRISTVEETPKVVGDVGVRISTVEEARKVVGEADSLGSSERASSFVNNAVDCVPQSIADSLTNNGAVSGEVHAGRESGEEAGNLGLSECSTKDSSRIPGHTSFAEKPPMAENLTSADKHDDGDRISQGDIAREICSPGNADFTDPGLVEGTPPSLGHEPPSPLGRSASSAFSGIRRLKSVKSRLKRSFSEVLPSRSSRVTASTNVEVRTKPVAPVDWLRMSVRKAVANMKMCSGASA